MINSIGLYLLDEAILDELTSCVGSGYKISDDRQRRIVAQRIAKKVDLIFGDKYEVGKN